ncbi:hypothetical protein KI387_031385, partial [Taxus chinensis]
MYLSSLTCLMAMYLSMKKAHNVSPQFEYAPHQGVPDTSKKDPREGTIDKDPKYLEFLELIAKPVENLPSAEIQLERKEAERAGGQKDDIVVTPPLMEFVRQKLAAKSALRLSSSSRRSGGRARGASAASSGLVNKRGIERGKPNNVTYVLRDTTRTSSNKDRSQNIVQQKEQQKCRNNEISIEKNRKDVDGKAHCNSFECTEMLEEECGTTMKNMQDLTEEMASGGDGSEESGKRRLLLSKGNREKEFANGPSGGLSLPNSMDVGVQVHRRQTSNVKGSASAQPIGGPSQLQGVMSPGKGASGSMTFKQNQRWESNGRVGRGMLLTSSNMEQQNQVSVSNSEKDKRPPRHPGLRSGLKDHGSAMGSSSSSVDVDAKNFHDEKNMYATSKDSYGPIAMAERQDRRTRNKDRPDRPVWTPRRRSDGLSGPEIEKSDNCSMSRQKAGLVEKLMEETYLQGDNMSESFVALPGKSLFIDLGGLQSTRRSNTNLGSVASLDNPSNQVDLKTEIIMSSGGGDIEGQGISRTALVTGENGNHRQILRRPSAPVTREADGASILDLKQAKRGAAVGYGGQE